MSTIQLYCANLHHGGALVAAATFLRDSRVVWEEVWSRHFRRMQVVTSTAVLRNLDRADDFAEFARMPNVSLQIRDDVGIKTLALPKQSADVRFSIRGPHYLRAWAPKEIAGFADGSLIHPYGGVSGHENLLSKVRGVIKRQRLEHFQALICQTQAMANAANRTLGVSCSVLPNSVSPIFEDLNNADPVVMPQRQGGEVRFFYPSRGYPHKNHGVIPAVQSAFLKQTGRKLRIVVTLRPEELRATSLEGTDIINVGEVTTRQCLSIYRQTDGLFFPSLNETYSAAPLEALFLGLPVVAERRPFIEEFGCHYCYTYENQDPVAIAEVIETAVSSGPHIRVRLGQAWARTLPRGAEHSLKLAGLVADLAG